MGLSCNVINLRVIRIDSCRRHGWWRLRLCFGCYRECGTPGGCEIQGSVVDVSHSGTEKAWCQGLVSHQYGTLSLVIGSLIACSQGRSTTLLTFLQGSCQTFVVNRVLSFIPYSLVEYITCIVHRISFFYLKSVIFVLFFYVYWLLHLRSVNRLWQLKQLYINNFDLMSIQTLKNWKIFKNSHAV